MGNHDWLLDLFNTVDIRAVDSVCANIGYELVIENGEVTSYNLVM